MEITSCQLKVFAVRHPIYFVLAFFSLSIGLDMGIIEFGHAIGVATIYSGLADIVVQALLALGVLMWFGWLQEAGFNRPARWRSLHLLWAPFLLALFYLLSFISGPRFSTGTILFTAFYALLVGLNEEARFRGVLLRALLPCGTLKGVALSSLFFGLAHVFNLLSGGPWPIILAQTISGFLLGFGFAACRLRINTIWPLIIFHTLYDFPSLLTLLSAKSIAAETSTFAPLTTVIGLIVPSLLLAIYGLFLLRTQPQPSQPALPDKTSMLA
ncbi:CPBP family intramembrane glutamic endopeptidase [Dictyobacter formicarum]|uniref:CAAX prenyl protease 2/Lysostaphin resistance protein A-like domain-containing protein n=1 Tax=Dictyobacter formicarum TaxID=2778368 RepID=A0ABQ3VTF6_9CHLR|nr:CPBP family intramembrane glutamic endopeptidase [Dictyobacter formicarum]GHO89564.1 hypothetical protein KSZ_75700 [Dictyobacter formicarum]